MQIEQGPFDIMLFILKKVKHFMYTYIYRSTFHATRKANKTYRQTGGTR